MIHTYPQSEILIKIDYEEFAYKYSPKWEASKSQIRYPSKDQLWDQFNYHTDGYLLRKFNGFRTKSPTNPDQYRHISLNGKSYLEHKCIAIMHLPEHIQEFESLPYEPIFMYGEIIGWSNLIVDHIQEGNKHHNRIENLQIISRESNWFKCGYQYTPPWEFKYGERSYSVQKDRELYYRTVNKLSNTKS